MATSGPEGMGDRQCKTALRFERMENSTSLLRVGCDQSERSLWRGLRSYVAWLQTLFSEQPEEAQPNTNWPASHSKTDRGKPT